MTPDNPTEIYHRQLTALYYLGVPLCNPPEGVTVATTTLLALKDLEAALLRVQIETLKRELTNP